MIIKNRFKIIDSFSIGDTSNTDIRFEYRNHIIIVSYILNYICIKTNTIHILIRVEE